LRSDALADLAQLRDWVLVSGSKTRRRPSAGSGVRRTQLTSGVHHQASGGEGCDAVRVKRIRAGAEETGTAPAAVQDEDFRREADLRRRAFPSERGFLKVAGRVGGCRL
jgi:hypothetical protein